MTADWWCWHGTRWATGCAACDADAGGGAARGGAVDGDADASGAAGGVRNWHGVANVMAADAVAVVAGVAGVGVDAADERVGAADDDGDGGGDAPAAAATGECGVSRSAGRATGKAPCHCSRLCDWPFFRGHLCCS